MSKDRPGPPRATVRDVAARAGVSPGTVSKALNGTGQISPATRARIVAAAEEIDFRPNALARSVFDRRSARADDPIDLGELDCNDIEIDDDGIWCFIGEAEGLCFYQQC